MTSTEGSAPAPAPQSHVILAATKDEYYVSEVLTQLHDVVEKLKFWGRSGSSAAPAALDPELSVVAHLLYLTTTGSQTMGEEYCDIYRVKGGLPLSTMTKTLWLLMTTVLPYVQQRSHAGWTNLHPGEQQARLQQARRLARERLQLQEQQHVVVSAPVASPRAPSRLDAFLRRLDALVARAKAAAQAVEAKTGTTVATWAQTAVVLHLALFYLNGKYFAGAKRIFGIRYVLTRQLTAPAAQFSILGYLIVLRVALSSVMQLPTFLRALLGVQAVTPLLDHSRVPAETPTAPTGGGRKCALCLAERSHPALTPCGHVFCWECIVGWCASKPECPLCRQAVLPQDVKCMYNYK
ncbi:peroxisome assembly protein [Achlya hypogyna]|uniref:RING-type E3 ubiquitin transferase n=1 Tax=Achlya hypogyna TaxID=1202772 RepID=A0A1V9Y5Y1_ACHHY|nr:peroxisome assembly protein [Achlya hypogyna]